MGTVNVRFNVSIRTKTCDDCLKHKVAIVVEYRRDEHTLTNGLCYEDRDEAIKIARAQTLKPDFSRMLLDRFGIEGNLNATREIELIQGGRA